MNRNFAAICLGILIALIYLDIYVVVKGIFDALGVK
jgi:hypothetical protein